jgi:hypothetical protein
MRIIVRTFSTAKIIFILVKQNYKTSFFYLKRLSSFVVIWTQFSFSKCWFFNWVIYRTISTLDVNWDIPVDLLYCSLQILGLFQVYQKHNHQTFQNLQYMTPYVIFIFLPSYSYYHPNSELLYESNLQSGIWWFFLALFDSYILCIIDFTKKFILHIHWYLHTILLNDSLL